MAGLVSLRSKNSDARWGKKTPAVILALGCIAIFQVIYQAVIVSRLHEGEKLEDLHDACSGSTEAEESYQCLEQQIYLSWQEEARHEERVGILQSTLMTGHEGQHKAHVERVVSAVAEAATGKSPGTMWEEHKRTIHEAIEAQHLTLPDGEREKAQEIHAVHGDRLLEASLHAVHANDGRDSIDDIKQRLLNYQLEHERHRQERAEKFRQEHEERMKEFDRLYDQTMKTIHASDKASEGEAGEQAAEPEEPKSEFDRLYEAAMTAIHAPTTPSPWLQRMEELQKQYDDLSHKNEERRASHKKQQEARRPKTSGFLASQNIRWQPVTQWKTAAADQDTGLVVASWEDLHWLKWSGDKPHVACITMVPPGSEAVYQIMYFVDNWKLQTWESKELVLVYQHSDKRLAKVLEKYVDGTLVKAVAARDGEFPSTAAARFGAWSVKADVIARWDFQEWHHPEQLTLQVKALAMTSRPASLLQPYGTHGAVASDRETSIVGEAKWMREEWYPFLKHGSDILEEDRVRHIVQVDVPKLDINAQAPQKVPLKDTLDAERAEIAAGVSICMRVRRGEHQSGLTMSRGSMPVPDLEADREQLADTHRDTDVRLMELCAQAELEGSLLRRAELHREVARLSSFEAEIAGELEDPKAAIQSVSPLSPISASS